MPPTEPVLHARPLELPADGEALCAWLAADEWPFHGQPRSTLAEWRARLARGRFADPDERCFWLLVGEERVGFLSVQEVGDLTPLFDLRLRAAWRGRGLGGQALAWLAGYVFDELGKSRVEGHTRADNRAMRRVFLRCGWVKEGHARAAWPDPAGRLHDAITYALLAEDWRSGRSTPVNWDDRP